MLTFNRQAEDEDSREVKGWRRPGKQDALGVQGQKSLQ
jgi:hypothetical protein